MKRSIALAGVLAGFVMAPVASGVTPIPTAGPTGTTPPPAPSKLVGESTVQCPDLAHGFAASDGNGGTWSGSWNEAPSTIAPMLATSIGPYNALVCTYSKAEPNNGYCGANVSNYRSTSCTGTMGTEQESPPPCKAGSMDASTLPLCIVGGYGYAGQSCWYTHIEGDTQSPPYGTAACYYNAAPYGPTVKCTAPTTDGPDANGWTTTRTFWGPFALLTNASNGAHYLGCTIPFQPVYPGTRTTYAVASQPAKANRVCTATPASGSAPAAFDCKFYLP